MAHIFAPGDNPLRMDFNIQRILGPNVAITRSAQSLVYEVDGYRYAFTASGPGTGLTYDAQGRPIAGVMTAFEYSKDGVLLYSQAGLAFSADTLASSGSFLSPNGIPDRNFLLSLALGNDHFHGSAQDDWIIDIANHNILDGGAGRDTLIAGDGNDHIYGHSANGGPDGADSIQAGGGGDYVQGNAGNDTIFGGAGSDRINGGADDDALYGDAGNDTINGNRGNDGISGDEGNDVLRGGQGNDTIDGGAGNDVLMGDLGADWLFGYTGADLFVFGPTSSPIGLDNDRIADFEQGIDHISLGFLPQAVLVGTAPPETGGFADKMSVTAQALFDQHPGNAEVAVLTDGFITFLFWSGNGGGVVDSVVQIGGPLGLTDFI